MHAFMLVPLIALAHPAQVRVRDDFTGTLASRWQVEAGQWKAHRGQLLTDALDDSMIWHFSSPEFEAGAITASMIPIRRLPAGSHTGWATSGSASAAGPRQLLAPGAGGRPTGRALL